MYHDTKLANLAYTGGRSGHQVEALAFWSRRVTCNIDGFLERGSSNICDTVRQAYHLGASLREAIESVGTIISRPVLDGFTTDIAKSSFWYTQGTSFRTWEVAAVP
jgi:hypothetical protein